MRADHQLVLVCGMSRSGTTLLCTMLDSHPEISMGHELMPPGGMGNPAEVATAIEGVAKAKDPVRTLIDAEQVATAKFVRFAERVKVGPPQLVEFIRGLEHEGIEDLSSLANRALVAQALVSRKMSLEGTRIGGFKNNSPDSLPFLEWFPQARFVFIVRDPRDVAASHQIRGLPKDVDQVCKAWSRYVGKFADFETDRRDQAMIVRYEDLVNEPIRQCERLAELIGIADATPMLDYHSSSATIHGTGHIENDRLRRKQGASAIGRWRRVLADEQVDAIEASVGELMERFGYEAAGELPPRLDPERPDPRSDAERGPSTRAASRPTPHPANLSPAPTPGGRFPYTFVTGMLDFLAAREEKVEVITYTDFEWCGDYEAGDWYPEEFSRWRRSQKSLADAGRAQVLIQHDVDTRPEWTMELLRAELERGIRSNLMIFEHRIDRPRLRTADEVGYTEYPLDEELLARAEHEGFVVGFHFNSMERAKWDPELAGRIFVEDLEALRERFTIEFASAHGGVAGPGGANNSHLPLPDLQALGVRWVHNGYTPRFDATYSDGGLNRGNIDPNTRDLRNFMRAIEPGKRYRILLHPQYYSLEPTVPAPGFIGTPWYEQLLANHDANPDRDSWADVELSW